MVRVRGDVWARVLSASVSVCLNVCVRVWRLLMVNVKVMHVIL